MMNKLSSSNTPLLSVQNITVALPKGSDRPHAVRGVSFDLNQGEILCIAGESGSGKSVLSSVLMGAIAKGLKHESGQIFLEGRDLTQLSEKDLRTIRGRQIAMIFQEPVASLNPAMKIGAQIEEVFNLHSHLSKKERQARVYELAQATHLPNVERILQAFPHQLSGGQCQRVVIAMALAMQPKLLIADEPTTALDVTTQAQILNLMRELRDKNGHGIIFITHDFGVVADIADRVAVMRYGEIVEIGATQQILKNPQHPYTQELIATVPSLRPPAATHKSHDEKIALQVKNLHHAYGALPVLKNINLTLLQGHVISIVGESGCGKSTLAKALIRLIEPKQGHITIGTQDFLTLAGKDLAKNRRAIQMIFQDPFASLNPRRMVGPMIARAARLAGLSRRQAIAQAKELLDLVGLEPESYWRKPSAFSGGQRQRIGIARALAMQPDILIADESVSALDVSVQRQVLDLLRQLQQKFKLAILFITHDLRVAAQISDSIIVMKQGEIVETGSTSQVLQNPGHAYTQSLIASAPGRNIF